MRVRTFLVWSHPVRSWHAPEDNGPSFGALDR
jgi:hypothetical protein